MADNGPEQASKSSQTTALLKNSVFWTAFVAAIVAAFANAYVALINNNTLVDVELHKETEERLIETKKAEFTRLLEISKLDVTSAKQKIQAFCEMLLITDPAICLASTLVKSSSVSQGNAPSTNTENVVPATWDSPWVGGGHNQQEICNNGVSELGKNDQYKGKVISLQSASEDSRKDFLGHVEYRYHCTYRVSDAGAALKP
jgi:hypothetical protein